MLKIVRHKSVIMWLLGAALGTLAASACDTPSPDTTTTAGTPSDSSGDTESGDPTTGGGSTGDAPALPRRPAGRRERGATAARPLAGLESCLTGQLGGRDAAGPALLRRLHGT